MQEYNPDSLISEASTEQMRVLSNPQMLQVMAEAGVSIDGAASVSIEEHQDQKWDLVVTLCDHAADHCPSLPQAKQLVHVPFPDPAHCKGSEAEVLHSFRQVRDQIGAFIRGLNPLQQPFPGRTSEPAD